MSFNTFYSMLKESSKLYGEKTAILYDTHAISYEKLYIDCCKKALHFKKFEKKRIALIGPASYRFIVNFFGAVLAGKDVVLLDSFLAVTERRILLEKAHPDYILSSTNQYILADKKGNSIPGADKDENDVDLTTPSDLNEEGSVLFFTSGTSELAKLVVLSSKNLSFSASQFCNVVQCGSSDKVLSVLPLNHVFGIVYSVLWPLGCGACVCIGRGIRHIDFDAIYYSPTILPAYPALLETLMRHGGLNEGLRTILIGESHCPDEVVAELEDSNYLVYSIYGMTAASGAIAVSSKASSHELVPLKDVSITIADDNEVLVSSNGLMSCYDGDQEATAEVLSDSIFHSGDLGYINEAGHLILTGNKKNLLALPNGEKMNCLEVEGFFNEDVNVYESALSLWNGHTTIWIYTKNKDFGENEAMKLISSFNKTKCSSRHINHFFIVHEELPKDSFGNLQRKNLTEPK